MKAFRFDAEAPVKGSGIKKDTGFALSRKVRTQNLARIFFHLARVVDA
jgi:hypothetical protein